MPVCNRCYSGYNGLSCKCAPYQTRIDIFDSTDLHWALDPESAAIRALQYELDCEPILISSCINREVRVSVTRDGESYEYKVTPEAATVEYSAREVK